MHGTKHHAQNYVAAEVAAGPLVKPVRDRGRWSIGYESIETITVLSDIVTILFASILSGALYRLQVSGSPGNLIEYLGFGAIVAALFVLWMKSRRMYGLANLLNPRTQVTAVCLVWICIFLLLSGAIFAMSPGDILAQKANILFATVSTTALIAHRVLWKALLKKGVRAKHIGRKVVLITDHRRVETKRLSDTLQRLGFCLEHRFTLPPLSQGAQKRADVISQVIACVRSSDVEEVVVAADPNHWFEMQGPLDALRVLPLPVNLVPVGPTADIFSRRLRVWGGSVCVELQRRPLSLFECAVKRAMDLVGAASALVILTPLLSVVMVAIKLDSPGPLLFRQTRCGFNGRQFQIMKFRTMSVMENGASIQQASVADPRVTRVGKWLRRASVDELPQLLNVLRGSMSLVGPRPHAIAHDIEFNKIIRNYACRQRVKPGLTGWAQIHGFRGPTPNAELVRSRVEHDLWYIDHWSIWLDVKILLKTVAEVIRGRNAC